MYCPECRCEFAGWTGKCPECGTRLLSEAPAAAGLPDRPISYEGLVGLVREGGGELKIELSTTEVGRERRWSFPYFGYGLAWAKRMAGHIGGNEVSLMAKEVGTETKWRFPYLGYGYAWTQEMSGECGTQLDAELLATDVRRHRGWGFPYLGYGFAWVHGAVLTLTLRE